MVAAAHFVLVARAQLNPWLGGGFGMFSTTDHRWVRVLDTATREALSVPSRLREVEKRATALPTRARLLDLARAAREQGGGAGDAPLRVEVWETRFGPDMAPRSRRLHAAELRAAGR